MTQRTLWEILVPVHSNAGKVYSIAHHQKWDEKARQISGGLTILKPAKGQWVTPKGALLHEQMLPVRVLCTEKEMDDIIQFTLRHYDQHAVLAYQLSSRVKLVYKKKNV